MRLDGLVPQFGHLPNIRDDWCQDTVLAIGTKCLAKSSVMEATAEHTRREDRGSAKAGPVVSVQNLTKRYGDVVAVEDLTFALEPGTITGFLGPNGAGKSTTLRLLLGLARPTSGAALVFGSRYADLDQPARQVGAVLESSDFNPGRSGRNHLRAIALAIGIDFGRVEEVLELVDLGEAGSRPTRSACDNASGWPERCWVTPSCYSSTNRPMALTLRACTGCEAFFASSPSRAAPFWFQPCLGGGCSDSRGCADHHPRSPGRPPCDDRACPRRTLS